MKNVRPECSTAQYPCQHAAIEIRQMDSHTNHCNDALARFIPALSTVMALINKSLHCAI